MSADDQSRAANPADAHNPMPVYKDGPEESIESAPRKGLVSVGPGGNLDLDNAFTYHAPHGDQIVRYAALRSAGKDLAAAIAASCPPSPERTAAINRVREAIMWANASIACHEKPPTTDTP